MKNKTLFLIPALAVALAVSGCGRKETPKPVVSNNNAQQVNQNTNTNSSANTNTNINTNANIPGELETNQKDIRDIPCSSIDYQGQATKEGDGWKRYVNKNLGIEFRFKDEEDKMNVGSSRNGINIEVNKDVRNQYKVDPDINLDIFSYNKGNGKEGYGSLEEFIKEEGAGIDFNEIISMEEIKNDNNLNFLKVLFKITRMPSMPPFDKKDEPERSFEITIYYIEYNRPLKCVDDFNFKSHIDYYDAEFNTKGQNYISIRGTDEVKQIIESLKFIN